MGQRLFNFFHYLFVEMLGLLLGSSLMMNTIKTLSLGDCNPKEQSCGYGYILNEENYSEDVKPVHYIMITIVLFCLPIFSGLFYVIGSPTPGIYFSRVLKFQRSMFWKILCVFLLVTTSLLGLFGFVSSNGGLPHEDPIGYWSVLLVAVKELSGSLKSPKYEIIDMDDKDVHEIVWKLGSVMDIIKQKKCSVFEMDIVAAKLVRSKKYLGNVLKDIKDEKMLDEVDIDVSKRIKNTQLNTVTPV